MRCSPHKYKKRQERRLKDLFFSTIGLLFLCFFSLLFRQKLEGACHKTIVF